MFYGIAYNKDEHQLIVDSVHRMYEQAEFLISERHEIYHIINSNLPPKIPEFIAFCEKVGLNYDRQQAGNILNQIMDKIKTEIGNFKGK